MTMLSSLLIKETFDQFNLEYEKNKNTIKTLTYLNNKTNTKKVSTVNTESDISEDIISKEIICISQKQNNNFIENIEEKKYYIKDNEVKYKIFEDTSLITIKNNDIELIFIIPTENNIISINKIKLSNQLNKYIKNIYLNIDNKIIINNDEKIDNKWILSKNIEHKENFINNSTNKNINLHIILVKKGLNHIINKNIFVNYSCVIYKNKVKFV